MVLGRLFVVIPEGNLLLFLLLFVLSTLASTRGRSE